MDVAEGRGSGGASAASTGASQPPELDPESGDLFEEGEGEDDEPGFVPAPHKCLKTEALWVQHSLLRQEKESPLQCVPVF